MNKCVFKGLFLVVNIIFFPTWSLANDAELALHMDCAEVSDSCIKVEFVSDSSRTIVIKKEPEMIFNQLNVLQAEVTSHEVGQQQLQIRLKEKAAAELARVTGNHIGKRLVVVSENKAITAPTIREAINSGSFVIAAETSNGISVFEGLPWLKEMSD